MLDWACANVGRIQALHTKLSGLNNVISNVPLVLQKVRVMVVCCSVLRMEFVWEESCGVGRKVLSLRMDVKCSGNCELSFGLSELCSFDVGAPKSLFNYALFF